MADGAEQFGLAGIDRPVDPYDPIGFEARLAEARERRAVALARRTPVAVAARPAAPVLVAPTDRRRNQTTSRRSSARAPIALGGLLLAAGVAAAGIAFLLRAPAPAPIVILDAPALSGLPPLIVLPTPAIAQAAVANAPLPNLQAAVTADPLRVTAGPAVLAPTRPRARPPARFVVSKVRTASPETAAMPAALDVHAATPALTAITRSAAGDGRLFATTFPKPPGERPASGRSSAASRPNATQNDTIQAALGRAGKRISRWLERAAQSLPGQP